MWGPIPGVAGRRPLPGVVTQAVVVGAMTAAVAALNGSPLVVDALRLSAPAAMLGGVLYLQVRRRPPDWTPAEHDTVAVAGLSALVATTLLTAWAVYVTTFSPAAVLDNAENLLLAAAFGLAAGTVAGRLYAGQQRAARELRTERERLEAFATVLSHDLRSPLTVAKSRIDLARGAPDAGHLDDADSALDRMEGIIEEVLTLAREGNDDVDPLPVDVGDGARPAWGELSHGEASLRLADPPTVDADRRKLRRLLVNLLENATVHADPEEVVVGALDDEPGFYVADDGPGVDPSVRADVFDRGVTTADGGHGLGLAIVAELAEVHGWTVDCVASEAGGARFEVHTGD